MGTTHEDYECLAERLCTQLAIMSQVKVIRQRFNDVTGKRYGEIPNEHPTTIKKSIERNSSFQMLGIVASTGGPNALSVLLKSLGSDFPLPITLVQHIN